MSGWLGKRPGGVFATATLRGHLVRGALAFGLFAVAVAIQQDWPVLSVAAGLLALVAVRGCPVCWTIGLIETLAAKKP